MGQVFERELKGILNGDKDILARITRSCNSEEQAMYRKITRRPFLVIRAAGSMGVDLVACRDDFAFPIEVKSSANNVLRFSKSEKLIEQANQLKQESMRSHLFPLYAYRYKRKRGDSWRIFALEVDNNLNGRMDLIYRKLPKIDQTKEGNLIMRWEKGMPLSKFIEYLDFLTCKHSK